MVHHDSLDVGFFGEDGKVRSPKKFADANFQVASKVVAQEVFEENFQATCFASCQAL